MNLAQYNKLWTAIAAGLVALAVRHGFDLTGTESEIANLLSIAFTAVMVYVVPNKTERTLS